MLSLQLLHLEKGPEVEFSGIDEIESILSPDYFEYVSENKARFKGETADYSVLYDPANELLYIEKAGATYPDGLWFCGANWGHPQARLVTTSGWSMDGPNNVLYCYKSADCSSLSTSSSISASSTLDCIALPAAINITA